MDYLLPMALEFGMNSDEFWRGNPNLFNSYRTFYINKTKRDSQRDNEKAWLFGLYNNMALAVNLSNMWKKSTDETSVYLEKPIDFSNVGSSKQTNMSLEAKLKANLEHFSKRGNFISKTK